MVFKYNFIRPKGKGRKDGSKGYLKPIVKPSPTDKEKTEERKGDIPEEHLGGELLNIPHCLSLWRKKRRRM